MTMEKYIFVSFFIEIGCCCIFKERIESNMLRCLVVNYNKIALVVFLLVLVSFIRLIYELEKSLKITDEKNTIKGVNNKLSFKNTTYLCMQTESGLGNHMYMFASSYGMAKRKGMKLVLTNDHILEKAFKIHGAFETNMDLCKDARVVSEAACCRVSKNVYDVSNNTSVIIKGFVQSYKYFEGYEKDIRNYFKFRDNVLAQAKTKLKSLLSSLYPGETHSKRTLVGIHIHRGNFLTPRYIKKGYYVASSKYIYTAQTVMQAMYSNITYIVCTNDMDWTKEVFQKQTNAIVAPIGPAEVDLALLTLTDHVIMTVGTYGWWASWLVDGTTIYIKNFTRPGSLLDSQYDIERQDLIPPNWIGL